MYVPRLGTGAVDAHTLGELGENASRGDVLSGSCRPVGFSRRFARPPPLARRLGDASIRLWGWLQCDESG